MVPDIATFSVDDGFSYAVPEGTEVCVGSRVRIRVSGRRLKGFVTAVFDADPARSLLGIDGLSGDIPSFDEDSLVTLRWAAMHYVAPLSVLLRRTIPPNVPKHSSGSKPNTLHRERRLDPSADPVYKIAAPPYGPLVAETIRETAETRRNIVVIAPSVVEIDDIAAHLADLYDDRIVLATSSMPGGEVTRSWVRIATQDRSILIGTREIMLWPFRNVGVVVVVEDGRRVMRSQGTPTLNVREVVLRRSTTEGFPVVFLGPVPTLETVVRGATVRSPSHRQWPLIEIVDRGEEPPGFAMLTEKAKAAIRTTVAAGHSAFVLVGSRGYAPAFQCVRCGEVRRCPTCSSAASRDDSCRRCGTHLDQCIECGARRFQPLGAGVGRIIDDIAGIVGNEFVGRSEDNKLVTVGTERDLIGVGNLMLAVAIDMDGLTMAPHYRATEDGLRLLVRLAQTVRRGAGNRCIIQTAEPHQPVADALLSGRSEEFLMAELESREQYGFPPMGQLIAIETDAAHDAGRLLSENVSPHATIMGPAQVGERTRWLVQGEDLDSARLALRPVLNTLRAKGARVRVDVDPIDL